MFSSPDGFFTLLFAPNLCIMKGKPREKVLILIRVFQQVLILLIFALAGFVLIRTRAISGSKVDLLSTLEFYIFVPCVSFQTFSQQFTTAYLQEKYPLLLVSMGLLLLFELLARLVAPLLTKEHYRQLVLRYSMIIPNFGFFGYSLMQGLYGMDGLMDMMLFTLPMSVYTCTVGYAVLTDQPGSISLKKVLTPSIFAMALGAVVGISGIALPDTMQQIIASGAACMSPICMLLAGAVIAQYNLKELLLNRQAYIVCAVRLLVVPALIFGLLKLTGLEMAMLAAVLTYCCPCGLNPIVYGKLAGKDCRDGASLTLICTVLAMVTIPLCVHFFIK